MDKQELKKKAVKWLLRKAWPYIKHHALDEVWELLEKEKDKIKDKIK